MNEKKFNVFISSVQGEFKKERSALEEYISSDALLKLFFTPFLFERISARSGSPEKIFLKEVEESDIYIGLLGKNYGFEDESGISPTEKEYNAAGNKGIPRWIYILKTLASRNEKEELFIKKVSREVSWKFFSNIENLKKEIYRSCIEFLKQKGKIENNDFDNSLNSRAELKDLDNLLIREFIELAHEKRNFPEKTTASKSDVLKRLNLIRDNRIVNSALLVFAKNPQRYFPSATVKCAHFHGISVQKPIPDYKEFSGTIFEMADSALDFVLSKISLSTGTRDKSNLVETDYEIPRSAIAEAVINALAHRDYYSNGSVQVSIFQNRIEIENPGHLPNEITIKDLKRVHASYPHNPLLAKCLFYTGAIESYGTGTLDMIQDVTGKGLPEPEFTSRRTFKVTLWRKAKKQAEEQVGEHVREQDNERINLTIFYCEGQMPASQIMKALSLKGRRNFLQNYLQPAIDKGFIEMTHPDKPTSKTQTYSLTHKGVSLKKTLTSLNSKEKNKMNVSEEIQKNFGKTSEEVRLKFGSNVFKTLEIIFNNQEITAKEIAFQLNLSPRTIENYLAKLKRNGYLNREGSTKDGRWIINYGEE